MPIKVGYFVREATTNLRRNKLMTMAAALTAAVSLLLLGGVLTLGDVVSSFTRQLENAVEVQVFLKDGITEAQKTDIRSTLDGLSVVKKVRYISKDEAYKEFKSMYRDQPALYENVGPDVLPASFDVQLTDPKRIDLIRSNLGKNPAVDQIVDEHATVKKIVQISSFLRGFSVLMVIVLMGAAVLLISNATQLAIYARRREIEIMKLVGATNWFVRLPFMLEGVAAGVAGAIIAILLLALGKTLARSFVSHIALVPTVALHGVAIGQWIVLIVVGIVVGAAGAAVAMRRFLEV
jgi:cell division transport system permease protein